jgi:hypothetical protein
VAEGRGGVVKRSFATDLVPIPKQNRAVFESLAGAEFNPDRAVKNRKGYWNRWTTPPRPSATPPPAEEGSPIELRPLGT